MGWPHPRHSLFRPLLPILLGFVVISGASSLIVPVLEAPDEPSHVAMVRYILEHRTLPVQRPPDQFPAGQEGSQPPLYYAMGALALALSPTPGLAPGLEDINPYVDFNRSRMPRDNRNLFAHTHRDGFPYRGDVLGIHLVRLVSVALGGVTVLFTALLARELLPGRPLVWVLAPSIVAFNPQFVFLSGVVNSDNGIAASATLVCWCLVRWIVRGRSTPMAIALGLGLGGSLLMKVSGLLLVPLLAAGVLADWALHRQVWPLVRWALVVGLLAAGTAGWWFFRNYSIYGDPLGWQAMLAASREMVRPEPLDAIQALRVLWNARGSYWGALGWTNLLFDEQVYRLLDIFVAVCGGGLAVGLGRLLARPPEVRQAVALVLMVAWPVVVLAALVRWVQINEAADQGRLLFPAASAVGIFLAAGLDELRRLVGQIAAKLVTGGGKGGPGVGWSTRRGPAGMVVLGLVALGVAANLMVIVAEVIPAYYPSFEVVSREDAAPMFTFGSDIDLLEYRLFPPRLEPDDALDVELVWGARRPPDANLRVVVTLIGEGQATLDEVRSWPQGGRAPTSGWQPGYVVMDRYRLLPKWDGKEPQLAMVWLGLLDPSGGSRLPVTDGAGRPAGRGAVLGWVKLRPAQPEVSIPSVMTGARFGNSIELVGYDVDRQLDRLDLTLYWRALASMDESYTVFVHVTDAGGRPLAQHDSLPRVGSYPTNAWEAGEVVRDRHEVDLSGVPPGTYRVQVGLYLLATGGRLRTTYADGAPSVRDTVHLFELVIPEDR